MTICQNLIFSLRHFNKKDMMITVEIIVNNDCTLFDEKKQMAG